MLSRIKGWSRRRKVVAALTLALGTAAILTVSAFAYYGGSGSGSASASLGHAPVGVTVEVTSPASALYPGDSAAVPVTISKSGPGRAYIGHVEFTLSDLPAGCLASWFTLPDLAVGTTVANGGAGSFEGSSTLTFLDENLLQDACSDGAPTITAQAFPSP